MTNYKRNIEKYQVSDRSRARISTTPNTSTSTSIDTEPGVFHPDDLKAIRETYVNMIGSMTMATARMIERAMTRGLTPLAVIHAIEETGMALNPTPYYLRAILERYLRDGLYTIQDVQRDEEERAQRTFQRVDDRSVRWYGEEREWW